MALKMKTMRVVVTRRHQLTGWYLSVRELSIDYEKLNATDLEDAQAEALKFVRARCEAMLSELPF